MRFPLIMLKATCFEKNSKRDLCLYHQAGLKPIYY